MIVPRLGGLSFKAHSSTRIDIFPIRISTSCIGDSWPDYRPARQGAIGLEGTLVKLLKKWLVPLLLVAGAGGVLAQDVVPEALTPAAAGDAAAAPAIAAEPVGAELTRTDIDAWLDGFMPYAIESGDIAGAVVVVVKDGQVLTQRGFGYADIDKRIPVSPETTLFRTGSVSKLTTWTAVMQLVEQGKLDLDADVNTYLDFEIPAYDGKPVTLRNVMTHTAGFQETVRRLISDNQGDMVSLGEYVKNDIPAR